MSHENTQVIPGIKGLDHIGIAVKSLKDSISVYQSIFGARLVFIEENHEQNVLEAMLEFNGIKIQLLSPLSDSGAIYEYLQRHGEGIQQLALEVDNLDTACDVARKNGIRVVYEESKSGSNGSKINFLHPKSTTGALIELVQKKE